MSSKLARKSPGMASSEIWFIGLSDTEVLCIPSINSILKRPYSLQESIKGRYTNDDLQRQVKTTGIEGDLREKREIKVLSCRKEKIKFFTASHR